MSKEMKKAVGAVRSCFKRAGLQERDRLLLACSGGRDSLALARASQICCRAMGLSLAAAVVDHGIQEGSFKVAKEAQENLKKLGIQNSRVLKTSLDRQQVKINGVELGVGRGFTPREAKQNAAKEACEMLNIH